MKHFNIRVSGKVQGVFFRASTKEQAEFFGLKGFVRNEANGDVYIEIEGAEDGVQEFLKWCAQGPSRARVDNVSVEQSEPKNFSNFWIDR
jgi:acylphosphatase